MRRRVLLAATAAALWIGPASAAMVITADPGGPMSQYERRYATVRVTGEAVVIDGHCFSACTMLLGLVPRERVCVTPRARLGFHAAWFPDMAGGRVISARHTQRLHDLYPEDVRHWISRRGGLSARMIVLEGRELLSFLPACPDTAERRVKIRAGGQLSAWGHSLDLSAATRALGRGL